MNDSVLPPLGGEANINSWHFSGTQGPLPNPVGHTFPFVTHDSAGRWRLIGTGFYVSRDGLFVTARHVIEDVLVAGLQNQPLAILHLWSETGLFGPSTYLLRPVGQCWLGTESDVALGAAAQATNSVTGKSLAHWHWRLQWTCPPIGNRVGTYAFPNHSITQTENGQTILCRSDAYFGNIQQMADYRDQVLVPYPYMQVDVRIHGGASGGPIFDNQGTVVGINCTENQPIGPAFGAQIRCLQHAFLDDMILDGETIPRRVTFNELVSAGWIVVSGFVPTARTAHSGQLVRLNTVPVEAPGPSLAVATTS